MSSRSRGSHFAFDLLKQATIFEQFPPALDDLSRPWRVRCREVSCDQEATTGALDTGHSLDASSCGPRAKSIETRSATNQVPGLLADCPEGAIIGHLSAFDEPSWPNCL